MDGMLKQYIEECAKLPVDLKKNFDLIREIDIVVEQKADLIQQKLITLTKSHRGLSKDAQCAINKEINVSFVFRPLYFFHLRNSKLHLYHFVNV